MRYCKIKPNDIANSIGICVSLWTQGCPHHCKGCFNKETWDFNGGKEFTEADKLHIVDLLDVRGIDRNLSILGGEPLCPQNLDGVIDLCKYVKSVRPHTKIFIWTGYVIEDFTEAQNRVFDYIDVLVDGKFEEDKKDVTLKLRGSSNQRIIDCEKMRNSCKSL